jgi:hypothetical protein
METTNALKLRQTALKDFEHPNTCHWRWKKQWLDEEISSNISSIYIDRGYYFEYLCIGGGSDSSETVTDLPRLKNGAKGAEQQRIELQAERFREFIEKAGIQVTATQVRLEGAESEGTIDFLAIMPDGRKAYWDLKLTTDVTSTESHYSWGDLQKHDFTQQFYYEDLFHEMGEDVDCYLYVADYSTSMNVKVFKLSFDREQRRGEVRERRAAAFEQIKDYEANGWVARPAPHRCKNCNFTACAYRIAPGTIEEVTV